MILIVICSQSFRGRKEKEKVKHESKIERRWWQTTNRTKK
jgi:hypothetical protein